MVLALFTFPHRTEAKSLRSPLSWVPLKRIEMCSHAPKAGGGVRARGHSSTGRRSLNAHQGSVPSPGAKMLVVSSKQGELSDSLAGLMTCTLGDTGLTVSLCGNDFIQWMRRARSSIGIVCEVKNRHLQEFCCCLVNGKEILIVRMEAGFASSSASSASRLVVVIIKDMKHAIKVL